MVSSYAVLLFFGEEGQFLHERMNGCFDHVGWDDIGAKGIAGSTSCVSCHRTLRCFFSFLAIIACLFFLLACLVAWLLGMHKVPRCQKYIERN